MKLEFSYLSEKIKYFRIFLIIYILIIILLFSLTLITNNDIFFNFSLFMCFWLIIIFIILIVRKKYLKKYYNIISNGKKIKGYICGCYSYYHLGRVDIKYGEIHVRVNDRDKYYCFKDIVYNKKFKELESKYEEIWNKKKNNYTYRGKLEIILYYLNGEFAADLDSIRYVEE